MAIPPPRRVGDVFPDRLRQRAADRYGFPFSSPSRSTCSISARATRNGSWTASPSDGIGPMDKGAAKANDLPAGGDLRGAVPGMMVERVYCLADDLEVPRDRSWRSPVALPGGGTHPRRVVHGESGCFVDIFQQSEDVTSPRAVPGLVDGPEEARIANGADHDATDGTAQQCLQPLLQIVGAGQLDPEGVVGRVLENNADAGRRGMNGVGDRRAEDLHPGDAVRAAAGADRFRVLGDEWSYADALLRGRGNAGHRPPSSHGDPRDGGLLTHPTAKARRRTSRASGGSSRRDRGGCPSRWRRRE